MFQSVLEAIKMGDWDYEPTQANDREYNATRALPGTMEKLEVMASRLKDGMPLWHPGDRRTFDDKDLFDL